MSRMDAGRGMPMQAQGGHNTDAGYGQRRPKGLGDPQKPGDQRDAGDKIMEQRAKKAARKVLKDRTASPLAEVPRMPGETKEQMLPRKALGKQIINEILQNQALEERVKLIMNQSSSGSGLDLQG